ncbi:MAG: DNA-binding response regulator [Ignavibacteriales bacterium]|nr:MAG: DNA-binding response regulator [Ignavibacteriales bacterium]
MITVTIVEDNKIIREGLAALINGTDGFSCIGSYVNCESAFEVNKTFSSDVILMDIGLPGMSGIEGVKKIIGKNSGANILMLTVYDDNTQIFDALCAGACGYLVKKTPPTQLLEAIREAASGGSPMSSNIARKVVAAFQQVKPHLANTKSNLSDREKEVLSGLSKGKSYQEIADTLFISVDTVRHHIRNVYSKLQVHSQSEAVAKAIRKGLI